MSSGQKPQSKAPAALRAALSERYSDGAEPLNTSATSCDDELAAAIACKWNGVQCCHDNHCVALLSAEVQLA